jgi:hypothetical protein
MVEKISLKRRFFELNRRWFLESYPNAKSAFRCPKCEYPVLIFGPDERGGFAGFCDCIEIRAPGPMPDSLAWLELLNSRAEYESKLSKEQDE